MLTRRRGATLVELVVAITLAAVVLGAATVALLRQQRDAGGEAARARAESQSRAALAILAGALEGLSSSAGDIVAGEARDSALQLRTVVANGIACDSAVGQVVIPAADTGDARTSGIAVAPRPGDTVWWYPPDGAWMSRRVLDVSPLTGACTAAGAAERPLLRISFSVPDTVRRGAPVRLTRQTRYSFYHASDGTWQLGIADWSEVLHAFAPPQPVAGSFTLVAPDGSRTGLRYFDAAGGELPASSRGVNVADVARVRLAVIAAERRVGSAGVTWRRDSVDVAVRHAP